MHINRPTGNKSDRTRGFTLVEVVVSLAVSVILIGGILYGYTFSTRRAEWSAYSLAAHSLAIQRLEQMRAAKFTTAISEIADGTTTTATNLDTTLSGRIISATNITTITAVSTNPVVKAIKVDCVWFFAPRNRSFTNSLVTYRAMDY